MSYCVQCGVQLAGDLVACPLCHTPVVNPNIKPEDPLGEASYPDQREEVLQKVDKTYARQLSIIMTLIPMVIVLVIDFLDGGVAWSPFVMGALAMLWCFFAPVLVFKRQRPYVYVAVDVLALCGFLLLVAAMTGGLDWYLSLVLPLLVLVGLLTLGLLLLIRRKQSLKLYRMSLAVLMVMVFVVGLEIIIDLSARGTVHLGWSVYAGIPLLVIALMLAGLEQNKGLKEQVRRRLFI